MQAQLTLRPTRGLNLQATYTWSRQLNNSSWTNYTGDRFDDRNYNLSGQHRSHTFNTYGSYTLPFGSNGYIFRNASGAFKKAVEGWQLSWVLSMRSGEPGSVTGSQNSLWSDANPILARADLWDNKAGKAEWNDETVGGSYFGQKYTNYALDTVLCDNTVQGWAEDPAASTGLYRSYCSSTKHALTGLPIPASGAPRILALASGQRDGAGNMLPALYDKDTPGDDGVMYKAGDPVVVFRNADQRLGAKAQGDFRPMQITGPGIFSLDTAISKSVEFMEGKRIEIRVDAQNILNHPMPSSSFTQYSSNTRNMVPTNPSMGLSAANFGYLSTKLGRRTFQGKLRISF
jgi:hypothetical protein